MCWTGNSSGCLLNILFIILIDWFSWHIERCASRKLDLHLWKVREVWLDWPKWRGRRQFRGLQDKLWPGPNIHWFRQRNRWRWRWRWRPPLARLAGGQRNVWTFYEDRADYLNINWDCGGERCSVNTINWKYLYQAIKEFYKTDKLHLRETLGSRKSDDRPFSRPEEEWWQMVTWKSREAQSTSLPVFEAGGPPSCHTGCRRPRGPPPQRTGPEHGRRGGRGWPRGHPSSSPGELSFPSPRPTRDFPRCCWAAAAWCEWSRLGSLWRLKLL